jgi:DNA-entry nuclease
MKKSLSVILLVLLFSLVGCTTNETNVVDNNLNTTIELETDTTEETTETEKIEYITDEIPEYSGTKIIELNNNVPNFNVSDADTEFETYSELDELGRCGVAYANITINTMPTEERGEIGHIKPSGWHTVKYNGVVEGNYLYNRCHLIAFCLAGENDNKLNLVTGTRSFNVDSMYYYEEMVLNYMKENPNNRVLYRVTPIYVGDELVCRGVQMEGLSIEDDTICFNVFCYNVQDGVIIDYATGESRLENETVEEPTSTETSYVGDGTIYIINTDTMKIHTEDCRYADSDNTETFNGSIDYLLDNGYVKCKVCEP